MKKCHKCQLEKTFESFAKNSSKKDGYSTTCKNCHKLYNRQHYDRNKKYYLEKAKEFGKINKELVQDRKSVPCIDCNQSYPWYVMDFDHIRDKEFNVSRGISKAKTILLNEIEKCDVVCSNCHRIRTYNRRMSL